MKQSALILLVSLFAVSCNQESELSSTRGKASVDCDETLYPIMKLQADDFHNTYPDASISVRSVQAKQAVVDFVNDSVRTIILGKPFDDEELQYAKNAKVEYEGYKVALSAIAVILNKANADTAMRLTMLDSIYSGTITRWPGNRNALIDPFVGDINSSVDEVFRTVILRGRSFGPTVTRISTSDQMIEEVKKDPNAIGLVGLNWLIGHEREVAVCRLGGGSYRPDTTVAPGNFYSPAQAYVYWKYYPLTCEVYMYTREVVRNIVAYGFIAYVKDRKGQQNFLNHGLVPATQPVRIVESTSHKVTQQ